MKTESALERTQNIVRLKKVWNRLQASTLFSDYQKMFEASTGLPLDIEPAFEEGGLSICQGSENQSRFCGLLNGDSACSQCVMAQRCLNQKGSGVQSMSCFAGLQETAVPIVAGGMTVARLRTGQVFHDSPEVKKFKKVAAELGEVAGVSREDLKAAYLATPVVEKERYRAVVTLLAAFSLQLSVLAKQLEMEERDQESNIMEAAKDYIEDNLFEIIHLEDVAEEVFMSPFHFCRKFKESTGMTLTEYVTKRRVEEASDLLLETEMRVTDVAYEVGFQSLSQFNRSFLKTNGVSPTVFRKENAQKKIAA